MADPVPPPTATTTYTAQQIAEAQAREAAGAAQAAAINAAYRSNTLPVLPVYGNQVGLTPEQIAENQREQAKHDAAFHPAEYYGFDMANMANVPLSQIESRYGAGAADAVQSYYTQHPTARFQEISSQYNINRQLAVTGGSGSAATYRQGEMILTDPSEEMGGPVFTGRAAAYKDAWTPIQRSRYDYGVLPERTEMVPNRKALEEYAISPGINIYVPIGTKEQQLRTNAKIEFSESGAYSIWQVVPNTLPGSDFKRIYPWITAGGSDYALMSGMVSGKPQTPWIVDEYGMNMIGAKWDSRIIQDIRQHPERYSNLGSELYGGKVQELIPGRTIESARAAGENIQPGLYPAENLNFASLVKFSASNAPRGSVSSEANLLPFGGLSPAEFASMSPFQRVDLQGRLSPVQNEFTASVTGGKTIGGGFATVPSGIAATATTPQARYEQRSDPFAAILEGALFLGDTLTGGLWTPGKDLLTKYEQNRNPALESFNADMGSLRSQEAARNQLASRIESGRTGIESITAGKINASGEFTGTPEEYSLYKTRLSALNADVSQYNKYGESYNTALQKGFASGAIIPYGTGYMANPDLDRPYGAFSDWARGAGRTVQTLLGQKPATESQFLAYEQTPEFKRAGPLMQIGEGAYKVIATHPENIAGAFLQGVEIYATMGAADWMLGATAARGAAMGGRAGGALEALGGGGQRILQSPALQYGMGAALVGTSVYQATGGFTLPAEKAYSNIGGLGVNLAAMGWGGLAPEGVAYATRGVGFPNLGLTETMAGIPGRTTRMDLPITEGRPIPEIFRTMAGDMGATTIPRGPSRGPYRPGGPSTDYDVYVGTELSDWYRPGGVSEPGFTAPSAREIRFQLNEPRAGYEPQPAVNPEQRLIGTGTTQGEFRIRYTEPQAAMNPDQLLLPGSREYTIPREQATRPTSPKYDIAEQRMMEIYGTLEPKFARRQAYVSPTERAIIDLERAGRIETGKPGRQGKPWGMGEEGTFSFGGTRRARPGETLQMERERMPEIDLRPKVDLRYAEPFNLNIPTQEEALGRVTGARKTLEIKTQEDLYVTQIERRMIFQQYGFTPEEIRYAKANRSTLNDILAMREQQTIPDQFRLQKQVSEVRPAYADFFRYRSGEPILSGREMLETRLAAKMESEDYARTFDLSRFATAQETDAYVASDYARAFRLSEAVAPVPAQDYARAFATIAITKPAQDYARTFESTTPQDYARTTGRIITPTPEIPDYVPPFEPKIPVPPPPIPPPVLWPGGAGGSGMSGFGAPKGGFRFTEYLSFASDALAFGPSAKAPRMPRLTRSRTVTKVIRKATSRRKK